MIERLRLSLMADGPGTVRIGTGILQAILRAQYFGYRPISHVCSWHGRIATSQDLLRIAEWYSARGLARVRQLGGSATPVPSFPLRSHLSVNETTLANIVSGKSCGSLYSLMTEVYPLVILLLELKMPVGSRQDQCPRTRWSTGRLPFFGLLFHYISLEGPTKDR